MQESDIFFSRETHTRSEAEIGDLLFALVPGDRIFFSGDLWSGKSTFIRSLLRAHFSYPTLTVRSPTYTYYQKYGKDIYHFDLYRVTSEDDLLLIGAMDILEDPSSICLIEWPEILPPDIIPTKKISIIAWEDGKRIYTIEKRNTK